MAFIFWQLYRFFSKQKVLFYSLLILVTVTLAYFASRIRFDEDINSFIPQLGDSDKTAEVFKNSKAKDKYIFLFSAADSLKPLSTEELSNYCDKFFTSIDSSSISNTHVESVMSKVGNNLISQVYSFTYNNLPIFLDSEDYTRLDSLLTTENINNKLKANYQNLLSPTGLVTKNFITADPLGLANEALKGFSALELHMDYDIIDEHIFSPDHEYLLAILNPTFGAGKTAENAALVDSIEHLITQYANLHPDLKIDYFGGPAISVYNAKQIKADTFVTSGIALIIIIVFILLAFRQKSSVFLILLPVIFGAIFSLAVIYFLKGEISAISVGAGAAILGVALSYSIHVFSHLNHVSSPKQLIDELASPLTIGSFTTIAAFIGLTFAKSQILRDFGLFAAWALIGTTLFCLIALPHFLNYKKGAKSPNRLLKWIEKFNAYPFDKNKWLLAGLGTVALVCLFFAPKVGFNSDMTQLGYFPPKFMQVEKTLQDEFQAELSTVHFISAGETESEAFANYQQTAQKLYQLKEQGLIDDLSTASNLLLSPGQQQQRIEQWNNFWTSERKVQTITLLQQSGAQYGFKEESFNEFYELLNHNFTPVDYFNSDNKLFAEWLSKEDGLIMAINQVQLTEQNKEQVYEAFTDNDNTVILDKGHFINKFASLINDDFNLILYIASIVVFISLLLSYGRIELALLAFLPMAVSWVIILGIMGLFGLEFNIINIILSSFIFGIGDDFSIFITDGLLQEYRNGKKMLTAHKTAIFFSGFTIIVGMGALVFARHPALQSVAISSIIGVLAVIVVAYSVQPFIFKLLIANRTKKGEFPFTWFSLLMSIVAFGIFTTGCLVLSLFMILLQIPLFSKKYRKLVFHYMLMYTCRFLYYVMLNVRKRKINLGNEDFKTPAIVIANHQSFIDILAALSLSPRIVLVTNKWVWNSPFFGHLVRFADFYCITNGYENSVKALGDKVEKGFSVFIFPEGTRSPDLKLKRFHKGSFFLAQELKLDIIPVVFYGNGLVMSKKDPFYLKNGVAGIKILNRIPYSEGISYQEHGKKISRMFRLEYEAFCNEIEEKGDPYYSYKLVKNFVYKGPILEWYLRIKLRMENNYRLFNKLIPKTATVIDIGCGYGFLPYMLSFLSDKRKITGVDYDEDKITVANHCFSKNKQLDFIHADATKYEVPNSDVFVLNDMLHYLCPEEQQKLMQRCLNGLNTGGCIIIRDGDRNQQKNHFLTKLTELFSTRIVHFNKTENDLHFLSSDEIAGFAKANGLKLEIMNNDKYTSNTIYILNQ